MESLPYWKKVWYTITGQNKLVTEAEVNIVLTAVKDDILYGLNKYKPFTQASFNEWRILTKRSEGYVQDEENMLTDQLAEKIAIIMNLETPTAWKIFCNFLMFEYHVVLEDILGSGDYEMQNSPLLEQAWLFYSSERMFMIKTVKYILETCLDQFHQHHRIFIDCMNSLKFAQIRSSLFTQFNGLVDEINANTAEECPSIRDWVTRNTQEQLEILSSIILTVKHEPFTIMEIDQLFYIFGRHNFTNDPPYYETLEYANREDLKRVRKLEVITILLGLSPCWRFTQTWREKEHLLEEAIMGLAFEDYLCILVLTWTTLQMTLPPKIAAERFNSHYHKFTKAALKERVFVAMYEIVTDRVLQNSSVFYLVQITLYNILNYVCDKFDDLGSIMQHEGVIDLCIELVKQPYIAHRFLHLDGEASNIIYKVLYEMFPYTFDKYSQLVFQLIQHDGIHRELTDCLSNILHYTEEAGERLNDSVVRLMAVYYPYKCIMIKAYSEALIFPKYGKRFIKYHSNYTYYELGEEKMNQLIMKKRSPENTEDIEIYFQILGTILKHNRLSMNDIQVILDNVTNVLTITAKMPNRNYKLVKICLNLYETIMITHSEQVIEKLVANNFLPLIIRNPNDFKNFFDKHFLMPNIILSVIGEQMSRGEYDLLFAYFKLIKLAPKTEQNVIKIQIPNLIYLLNNILPAHLEGMYKRMDDKYEVTLLCLENLLEILTNPEPGLSKYDKIIYDFCYNIAANYEPTLNVLLRIFKLSNINLHVRMLKEFNWHNPLTLTNCIKSCMNIFIQIFSLHNTEEKSLEDTILFKTFFDPRIKPSSIRILINYLDHAFDTTVPKLACQLLKKISLNATIPILTLLEMQQHQIQNIFLEKLRDPLQEENVKVSILELITLCIEKQNGLTAAFFDLKPQCSSKQIDSTDCDTIITFMEEYLDNVQKTTIYLNSPLQGAVLDLFHTLWMYQKDILIKQLTQADNFWLTLTDPLFRDLKLSNKTYAQVFNIFAIELFRSKGQNDKINTILGKLFYKDLKYAKIWCAHIISCLDPTGNHTHGHSLLQSWKNFLVSVLLTLPRCLRQPELRRLLTDTCLNGLLEHFTEPDDIRILTNCAELYVVLMKHWSPNYYKDHRQTLISLTRIFKHLAKYYDHVNGTFKETILSIANQTVKDFHEYISSSHSLFEEFLYSVGVILEKEYARLISEEIKLTDNKTYSEWLLLVMFGDTLISLDFVETHPTWFSLTRFGHKVMISIGLLTGEPALFSVAKIAINCLIKYAKSDMIYDFLSIDSDSFFDSIRPPKQYIDTSFKDIEPQYLQEWWLTYTGVMQLMVVLVDEIFEFNMNTFFSFMSIHEDIIRNVLKLPRVTGEKAALQLTSSCLYFCNRLLPWRQEWKVSHAQVYFDIVHTIYETINAVTCIFLRPKVLTFFHVEQGGIMKVVETIPTDRLVNIMNQLMEIVALSCQCLLKGGPSLLSLLTPPIKTSYINDIEIQFDFHIPQLYQEDAQRITYSTILCLLDFMCKGVTSIHAQKISPPKAPVQKLQKSQDKNCLILVCPDFAGGYTISERYSPHSSEISGLSAPWLMQLNLKKVIFALESLASVIAVQTYISFNIRELKPDLHHHFKKELCSGLMYFYEFIRKRFVDGNQYRILDNMVYRRNVMKPLPYALGWAQKNNKHISFAKRSILDSSLSSDDEDSEDSSYGGGSFKDYAELSHEQLEPRVFFTLKDFASINMDVDRGMGDASSTIRKCRSYVNETCCYGQQILHGRSFKVALDKVVLKYPKPPEIKDSDYFLCLIHWFIFFCDLTH